MPRPAIVMVKDLKEQKTSLNSKCNYQKYASEVHSCLSMEGQGFRKSGVFRAYSLRDGFRRCKRPHSHEDGPLCESHSHKNVAPLPPNTSLMVFLCFELPRYRRAHPRSEVFRPTGLGSMLIPKSFFLSAHRVVLQYVAAPLQLVPLRMHVWRGYKADPSGSRAAPGYEGHGAG